MGEKLNSFTVKIFLRIVKIRRRFKWSWLGTQWYLTTCPNKDGSKAASSLGHLFLNNRDKDMETKKISWHGWWVVMVVTWLCGKIDSNIIETEQLRWHLWFGKGCLFSFFLVFFYHFFRWLKNFGGMASLANAAPRWSFHPWDIILKRNLQRKWSHRCFFRFKLIPCWDQTTGSPTQ